MKEIDFNKWLDSFNVNDIYVVCKNNKYRTPSAKEEHDIGHIVRLIDKSLDRNLPFYCEIDKVNNWYNNLRIATQDEKNAWNDGIYNINELTPASYEGNGTEFRVGDTVIITDAGHTYNGTIINSLADKLNLVLSNLNSSNYEEFNDSEGVIKHITNHLGSIVHFVEIPNRGNIIITYEGIRRKLINKNDIKPNIWYRNISNVGTMHRFIKFTDIKHAGFSGKKYVKLFYKEVILKTGEYKKYSQEDYYANDDFTNSLIKASTLEIDNYCFYFGVKILGLNTELPQMESVRKKPLRSTLLSDPVITSHERNFDIKQSGGIKYKSPKDDYKWLNLCDKESKNYVEMTSTRIMRVPRTIKNK